MGIVEDIVNTVLTPIKSAISGVTDGIDNLLKSMGNSFKNALDSFWSLVNVGFSYISNLVVGGFDSLIKGLSNLGNTIVKTLTNLLDSTIRDIENLFNPLVQAMFDLADNLSHLGDFFANINNIKPEDIIGSVEVFSKGFNK